MPIIIGQRIPRRSRWYGNKSPWNVTVRCVYQEATQWNTCSEEVAGSPSRKKGRIKSAICNYHGGIFIKTPHRTNVAMPVKNTWEKSCWTKFLKNVPQRSWWCRVHHKTIQSTKNNVHHWDLLTTSHQKKDNIKNTDLHCYRKDTWRDTSISTTIGFLRTSRKSKWKCKHHGTTQSIFRAYWTAACWAAQKTQNNTCHDNQDFGRQRPSRVMAVDMFSRDHTTQIQQ